MNTLTPEPTFVPTPVPTTEPTPTPAPKEFRIIGYVAHWDIVERIQFDYLTHINYAFLIPEADGTFADMPNLWKLKKIVSEAHAANVKVLISVGGWGYDKEFEAMAASPETRAVFVEGHTRFVHDYDLDGADIDWEYPGPGADSAQNFTALMQELDAVLEPKGKLLTAAVAALGEHGEGILAEVFDLVDYINVMAYDASGSDHSPYSYALDALDYWAGRGLPPEKTVLGVPFYSRPGEAPYQKIVTEFPEAAYVDEFDYNGSRVYYNGIPTIQKKTQLALERASGIMIWALAHDTVDATSLLHAIYQAASGN